MIEFLALPFAALAFTLSASAGMGGSLILVPALSVLLGPKEGVALAALLLAANNVAKVIAYRRVIPLRPVAVVLILTVLGAALGARLLVAAPAQWVSVGIIVSIALTFILERGKAATVRKGLGPALAFGAGATSGFSGTSGPLKGAALRSLALDRQHLVGAASVVSLAGDAMKVAVFSHASLLDERSIPLLLAALPLTVVATLAGRRLNRAVGERGYAVLFWCVMAGYSVRLLLA